LGKETWKGVFKQNSVNEAYNLFLYTLRYYYDIAMPRKRVKIKRKENKWVTTGIRVSGNRLRLLNILKKEGHMSEETKKILLSLKKKTPWSESVSKLYRPSDRYYCHYKRIYNNVIRKARRLTNTANKSI
jgi:hypothetical protein